jgi:hypothetical protein
VGGACVKWDEEGLTKTKVAQEEIEKKQVGYYI